MPRPLSLICLTLLAAVAPAYAQSLQVEARLVWGTNDENSRSNYVATDTALCDKLHGAFKWKNYYEITNVAQAIPVNESREFHMSDRCVLKIKNLGASRIQISCIGQGKEVSKGEHTLSQADWLVLGGNSKNNTAWFVGLHTAAPESAAR